MSHEGGRAEVLESVERRFEVQKKAEISGDNTGRKREEGDGGGVAQGVWCAGSKRTLELSR